MQFLFVNYYKPKNNNYRPERDLRFPSKADVQETIKTVVKINFHIFLFFIDLNTFFLLFY